MSDSKEVGIHMKNELSNVFNNVMSLSEPGDHVTIDARITENNRKVVTVDNHRDFKGSVVEYPNSKGNPPTKVITMSDKSH